MPKSESAQSAFLEKPREYVFLSEIMQEAWVRRSETTIDLLRPDVDSAGFDLVPECNSLRRYIQLKSSRSEIKTARQTVNARLAEKPGGCIV